MMRLLYLHTDSCSGWINEIKFQTLRFNILDLCDYRLSAEWYVHRPIDIFSFKTVIHNLF